MPLSLSKPLCSLIVGQIFLHAAMCGIRMAVPLQLLEGLPSRHGGALIGPAISMFSLAPLVLAVPTGRLVDRYGYHRPVQLAVLLTCLGGVSAVLSSVWLQCQYPLLCCCAMLSGAGCSMGLTTIQRSAGRGAHDLTELKRIFSWLGIAPSLSNLLGPAIAGPLIDHYGTRLTFMVLAVLPLITLAVGRFVPREPVMPPSAAARPPAWDLLTAPALRRLLLVSWLMSTSWDVHSFIVPMLGHLRGFSASAIASVLGAFALAITCVRLALPMLAHRLSEARALRWSLVLVACTFAVYPFATSVYAMAACAMCLGVALGTSQPMVMTTLHQITPVPRHGEAIALRSMTSYCSSALMPLAFGAASALAGPASILWLMAAVACLGNFVLRGFDPTAAPRSAVET